jgi:hypothetical protein
MASLAEMVVGILEPYVGRMVADTCVRATALSLGKSSDELIGDDMPALESNIKRLLGPIAPRQTIEDIVAEIEGSIR